ncbi:MAG: hypothetical protein ACO259_10185 [Bacteroidia bacterium]
MFEVNAIEYANKIKEFNQKVATKAVEINHDFNTAALNVINTATGKTFDSYIQEIQKQLNDVTSNAKEVITTGKFKVSGVKS